MSKFQESLGSDRFLVTVEAAPPRGCEIGLFLKALEGLVGKVDGINLPDSRGASIHLGPLAAALLAKQKGMEPILTISCRDRNRIAISSDLLGAYALGVSTVLCVSGDYVSFGGTPQAKPVYDLDSVQLIQMIRQMEMGEDIGGNSLEGEPCFCVGCVANPVANPLEPHLMKLEKKLASGVDFIQTLHLYDLDGTTAFLDYVKDKDVKVLAGLRLVTKKDVEMWENSRFPGNEIPEEIREEAKACATEQEWIEKSKTRMIALIKEVKASGRWQGIHLTADGHEELLVEILAEAGVQG